jgi:hypothetical protein
MFLPRSFYEFRHRVGGVEDVEVFDVHTDMDRKLDEFHQWEQHV